jgi:hypothetical protein
MLASSTTYGRGSMDLDYEVEIEEPRRFEFDINIKFFIESNPHTIRIEDVLGGYPWQTYRDIDTDLVIDITNWSDNILAFTREPFKVIVLPNRPEYYNIEALRTTTLIDSEYSYIALNKLKSKIDTGEDKELELFKLLKSMLEVGFNFLERYIEKKRVEE